MGGHVGTKGTHGGAVEVYVRHGDESHIRGGLGHALHIPKRLGVRDDLKRVNHIHGKQGIHSSFTRWEANQLVARRGSTHVSRCNGTATLPGSPTSGTNTLPRISPCAITMEFSVTMPKSAFWEAQNQR